MTLTGARYVPRPAGASPHPRFIRAGIRPHPDGGLIVRTPRGTTLRVHLTEAELTAVLDRCDGSRTLPEAAAGASRPGDVGRLLIRLADDGCLSSIGQDAADWVRFPAAGLDPGRPGRTELLVLGDGRLAAVLADVISRVARPRFGGITPLPDVAGLARYPRRGGQMVLCLADAFIPQALEDACQACRRLDLPWSYLCYSDQRGWFGPHFSPAGGPSFDDLRGRRLAAADTADGWHRGGSGDGYLPPDLELAGLLSAFLADVERWLAGAPAHGTWHEVEIDTVGQVMARHPVLPMPDSGSRPGGGPGPRPGPSPAADLLVDRRSGIIRFVTEVKPHPSTPAELIVMTAVTSDISRVRPWRIDPSGGGSSFGDAAAARAAAIGEAVERYCGNIIQPGQVVQASYDGLTARGDDAVDPETLVLFSAAQYEAPGFPFAAIRRDSVIPWYRGRSLTRNRPAWLPASLVYVNWHRASPSSSPPTNGTFYPGIAAGRDLSAALLAGLQEVVERHATMIWWLNGQPLPAIRPVPGFRPLRGKDIRGWLIYLPNEFGIPVLAAVAENTAESLLTVGFAARPDARQAAFKAWGEALILQDLSRDLQDPEGKYRRAIATGRLASGDLKPWRADRNYLDSYRADYRDVVSLMCQCQFHLDPRAQELARPYLETDRKLSVTDLPRLTGSDLRACQDAVESQGYEIFYADVTTPDVAAAGLVVTRTLVPGLVPNFPAAFPFLGRDAVQQSPVKLGWRSSPLAAEELNTVPLPHA